MKKRAFTLAEVLITLGIIGVVAALTIPILVGKYREKQTVTAVKTAYSIFSQAYMRLNADYPDLSQLVDSDLTDKENAQVLFNELAKYMKTVRRCDQSRNCMGAKYKSLTGVPLYNSWDDYSNIETGILANGMSFWVLGLKHSMGEEREYNGQIGIDINGQKEPNQLGVDFFWFTVDKYGRIYPGRSGNKPAHTYTSCDIENTTNGMNGYGCTEWILEHENMDYLRHRITVDLPEENQDTSGTSK